MKTDTHLHDIQLDFSTPIAKLTIDGQDFSKVTKVSVEFEAGKIPVMNIEIPFDDAHIIGRCSINKKFPDRVVGVPPYGYDADEVITLE